MAKFQYVKNNDVEVPAPDELIAGHKGAVTVDKITINTVGEYKRGQLMMSASGGIFIPVTKAGIASANEVCILCNNFVIDENETVEVPAYFSGDFNASKVILPDGTEISDVTFVCRKNKIFLRG
ncbi:MAG: hypothetical protein IJP96_05215 [Synergistaceae bacterium]|nr:hypothetical protein [Synergistaceae bacterium]MBQ6737241.1 hypothetical protein [Synergistaceae bacterium]MBR0075131.1 hypothetical protein [Synergistaceae bacterium]MBR0079413.1 hypothetical protein [Synergistaceae bacterium]MBR0232585.1 hypothetical protein [Synergistaceae bacterium]